MRTLEKFLKAIEKSRVFSLDTECEGVGTGSALDTATNKLTLVTLACNRAVAHIEPNTQISLDAIRFLLTSDSICVMHNAAFDTKVLHRHVLPMEKWRVTIVDTMVLSWIVDPRGAGSGLVPDHRLKKLVKKYLNYTMVEYKEVTKELPAAQCKIDAHLKASKIHRLHDAAKFEKARASHERKIRKHRRLRIQPKLAEIKENKIGMTKKEQAAARKELNKYHKDFRLDPDTFRQHMNNKLKRYHNLYLEAEKELKPAFIAYAEDDARQTLRLYRHLESKLKNKEMTWWSFIESSVLRVILDTEKTGIRIDRAKIRPLYFKVQNMIDALGADLKDMAPFDLNPDRSRDISRMVYNVRKLIPIERAVETRPSLKRRAKDSTVRAEYSIAKKILSKHDSDEFVAKYLERNSLKTLRNSFIRKLGFELNGNIQYTRFKPTGTKTGRFTSANPSLQQIPSRNKELAIPIREAFINRPGTQLIVADLSQIELRTAGVVANDPSLIEIYNRHEFDAEGLKVFTADVHEETRIAIGYDESYRWLAKNCNFGLLYGGSAGLLHHLTKIPVPECEEIREKFFTKYPALETTVDMLGSCYRGGMRSFSIPFSGRVRIWDGSAEASPGQIFNTMVQGSAADMLKAQIHYFWWFCVRHRPEWDAHMLLQIHDEVVWEVNEEYAEEAAYALKYVMEFPWWKLPLPIQADVKIGPNWAIGKLDEDDKDYPSLKLNKARISAAQELVPLEQPIYKQYDDDGPAGLTDYGLIMLEKGII